MKKDLVNYLVSIISVFAIVWLKYLIEPYTLNKAPFLLFYIPISLSTWIGGIRLGIFTTLLSTLLVDYFSLIPLYTILTNDFPTWVNIFLFVIQAAVIIYIVHGLKTAVQKEKLVNQELKYTSTKLQTIIDSAHEPIVIKDIKGKYLLLNPEGQKLFNIPLNQILGKDDTHFFPKKIARKVMTTDRRIMRTGKTEVFDQKLLFSGKERYFLTTKSPLKGAHGEIEGIIVIARDITERKHLEEKRNEFIGIASHELKTPLTSIKGYVQVLERIINKGGNDNAKLYIEKTCIYIDKLDKLIADLLDISKIQSGKMILNYTSFTAGELVDAGMESAQPMMNNHKIIKQGLNDLKVSGDKERLEQVFTNLLLNAAKYSPKSNKIIIDIKKEGGYVVFSVADFGIGIPKDKQGQVFNRYYRIIENKIGYPGLGLGLYISKEIIKRHKGKIWVKSEEGKGSTFYFSLPLVSK
ncbi:PAS domain-containing protein [Candidatus Daviesbacteria bacterium]|nr:PAS domain-containing protein [Candidatus Daviesbacteria bacterium]